MEHFLVILFMINGEPTIFEDGYMPFKVEGERCEEIVEATRRNLSYDPNMMEIAGIYCGTEKELSHMINVDLLSDPA